MIIAVIPTQPHAQGRPRFCVRGGYVRAYDPPASREWKRGAHEIMLAASEGPLPGPLRLTVYAIFQRPTANKREPQSYLWHAKRPDLDNIIKAVKDAGNGALWLDDSQVVQIEAVKLYAPHGCQPRVAVCVSQLSGTGVGNEVSVRFSLWNNIYTKTDKLNTGLTKLVE